MYDGLIIISVLMFGAHFILQDVFQKWRGNTLRISRQATFIGSISALLVMAIIFLIQRNAFEYTHFTLLIALILSLDNLLLTFCSFKALGTINLSLYSIFSMMGGMLLPFFQGILFYNESFTWAKGICIALIIIALCFTITKDKNKRGYIYYVGIFVLNGLSGVFSKIFTESSYPTTSSAGLNMWVAIVSIVLCAIILLFLKKPYTEQEKPINIKNTSVIAINGAVNRIANFLLVIALLYVDASVQYPMVTGGVMIVSTLSCYLRKQRPSVKELISVTLAFLAMVVLFVVPI